MKVSEVSDAGFDCLFAHLCFAGLLVDGGDGDGGDGDGDGDGGKFFSDMTVERNILTLVRRRWRR